VTKFGVVIILAANVYGWLRRCVNWFS